MELEQIEALLDSPDPQSRMKAITELRHHEPTVVVPLLIQLTNDREVLVRSFAVMGLGYKRNGASFEALVNILAYETDYNIIAEAANSLSKFGDQSLTHLVAIFEQYPHWLVRQSILAIVSELECPEVALHFCSLGMDDADIIVKQAAIANIISLKNTPRAPEALDILLQAANDANAETRAVVVGALRHFDDWQAKAALAELRCDSDYRVVAAVLEGLLETQSEEA
ncbi:MAG: HEAT repeat domain-containing protein [Cyanobacteria bacterium J06638_22]